MLPSIPNPVLLPAVAGTPLPTHEQIVRLQSEMLPIQCAQPEPEHIFHDGWYERRLHVPAGMLIVGKTHRHRHIVGVISGNALLISKFGREQVQTGYLSVSEPGVKRIVLAAEDTLFVTLHANPSNTRDLDKIEAEHICPEYLFAPSKPNEVLQ